MRDMRFLLEGRPPYDFYLTMEKNFAIRRSERAFGDLFDGEKYCFAMRDPLCEVEVSFKGRTEEPSFEVEVFSDGLSNREESRVLKKTSMLLGTDEDLEQFYALADPTELRKTADKLRGLHMLQFNGLFNALVLGILLQNAPVRRSMDMFSFLSERYARRTGLKKRLYLPLSAEDLRNASMDELRAGKLGYRAGYVARLAERFDGPLENRIEQMGTEKAKDELMRFDGVGSYTAEFALFGSNKRGERRYDVFPIDSWSLGIYAGIFSIIEDRREKAKALCRRHAEENFGTLMGLAFWYVMMSSF
jgi:3-methyladenine DNA glycosylase/8-oxoguanine DNA glycosylase